MSIDQIQSSGFVVPERELAKRLASGTTEIQSNVINNESKHYILHGSQESFDKKITLEDCSQEVKAELSPILDNIHSSTWKNKRVPVSGKKCCCHSVWCPNCFGVMYREQIKSKFAPFDWKYTRQVVLTVNPNKFENGAAALKFIRDNRSVAEFVRRLKRGVRQKIGKNWLQKFAPVRISRWAWFLEWHKNGFPHYHIFMEVDKAGHSGMIGADFIRDSWVLSDWVKEEYFNNEEHFKNLTGYYAGRGYFHKDKKHQGILPDVILDNVTTRIKRYGSSNNRVVEQRRKETNYQDVVNLILSVVPGSAVVSENNIDRPSIISSLISKVRKQSANKSINYRAILSRCGAHVFLELDIENYRLFAECDFSFKEWKYRFDGAFVNGRGKVNHLSPTEVCELLSSVIRVISLKKYQNIEAACIRRCEDMEKFQRWQKYAVDRSRKH